MANLDSQQRALYLLALVPGEELRESVRQLKLEMKKRFGAGHALKSPAHITLQMPFRRREKGEDEMKEILRLFSVRQEAFEVRLNGFDCFRPRVIFIDIEDASPIVRLHERLKLVLLDSMDLLPQEVNRNIHPHMTIATRDLSEKAFFSAWPEYENRPFVANFKADGLTLLKHNGAFWDIHEHFPFRSKDGTGQF